MFTFQQYCKYVFKLNKNRHNFEILIENSQEVELVSRHDLKDSIPKMQ